MSFAAGVFSLFTPGNPATTLTTISSSTYNSTLNDIATGLSTALLKDGTQTVTANIPMSTFIFTGLGAGTTSGHSVRYEQVLLLAGGTMTGNLLFTDNTLDIGASGATRPRTLYLGTSLSIAGGTAITSQTGTGGVVVMQGTPTLTTPVIGAATGTSATLTGVMSSATVAGAVVATQANMETGTAVDLVVTPGRQAFHPGHPKCWAMVTVSAGTPTLQTSFNISSITDTGVGQLTVTIATDFSSANWCCIHSAENNNSISGGVVSLFTTTIGSLAAGSVILENWLTTTTAAGAVDANAVADPI